MKGQDKEKLIAELNQLKTLVNELHSSNQKLRDFAFNASQDLQEHLGEMLLYGDLLKTHYAGNLDERGLDYLERMQGAVGHMKGLIEDILRYARATSGVTPKFTSQILNILLVEDDPTDALLIKNYIKEGLPEGSFTFEHATSYDMAMSCLHGVQYNIYLFDYSLSKTSASGLDLIRHVRHRGISAPIIFLTGQGDVEVAVEAIKAGATDYLVKRRLSSELLCSTISKALEKQHQELQQKKDEYQLVGHYENLLRQPLSQKTHWDTDFSALEGLLTRREIEVLVLLKQGLPNKDLATKLMVSPNTVKRHLDNMYCKLSVSSRTELLARAYRLVENPSKSS